MKGDEDKEVPSLNDTITKELTISEVARMGGNAVKKKYGKDYFKRLIKKRWDKRKLTN